MLKFIQFNRINDKTGQSRKILPKLIKWQQHNWLQQRSDTADIIRDQPDREQDKAVKKNKQEK